MNQQKQQEQQALAQAEPHFVMVAETEQGYMGIAQQLHRAGLLPKGRDGQMDVQTAAICMMYGREFGLSPLKSIYGIAPINGRPAPFGATLRGICEDATLLGNLTGCMQGVAEMKHVALEEPEGEGVDRELGEALRRAVRRRLARLGWTYDAEQKKWTQEGKGDAPGNYRCGFAVYKRKGRPVRVELFDSADGHLAGLLTKSGPWSQYPQRMLEARAVMFALKALYADKLTGLDVTYEEIDAIDTTAVEVKPPATSKALDELAAAPKPASAPVADTPAPIDAEFTLRPQADAPAEPKAPKSTAGSEALKAACAKIKAEGGNPADLHAAATTRALGEAKPSARMSDEEKGKVAVALEAIWTERKNPPAPKTDDAGSAS
jgi:hypothetical protein